MTYSPWLLVTAAFVAGIIFWGGFNWGMELTNSESFCISCHEMRDNVYQKYKNSMHSNNRSGVRATCPDCHVPKEWVHMVVRKIQATNELFHHFMGSINTREKFLATRLELAEIVWDNMKKTDSRECRNCHSVNAMAFSSQHDIAAEQHRLGKAQGKTCIDCHKGIVHPLPEEFLKKEHLRFEREGVACIQCHEGMAHPPDDDEWE